MAPCEHSCYVSDEMLAIFAPIAAFWVSSSVYELVAYLRPDARLHSKEEEKQKNVPSRWTVTKYVLFQQAYQIAIVVLYLKITGGGEGISKKPQPSLLTAAWQFLVAMVVLDTWQYLGHRYMHMNKFLYRHVHSTHHALVVPYAIGGLYSHPLDGLFLDTFGGLLAAVLSGMTPRTSAYFFSFATVRTVDIHCGLWLPWSPSQLLFGNNPAFHDTHHQLKGFHHNFAQPFFVAWDKILGTYMPFSVEKRKEGGYEVQPADLKEG